MSRRKKKETYGDRWQVVPDGSLGEGGQAHTFLVRDIHSGSPEQFVLKRLKNPKRLGRFTQEIEALNSLDSERVSRVVDFCADSDPAYFVTPYRGLDLSTSLKVKPLNLLDRLVVFRDVVAGVAAAHGVGVIHRDIKPNNVVIDDDSRACVIDFGICQMINDDLVLTTTDEAFGNAAFAAPECFLGSDHPIGTKSDVYSLGLLLLWIATNGKHMSRENLSADLIAAIDHEDPWVKAYVAQLVQASTVTRQIADAPELLDALDSLFRGIEPHVHPADPRRHLVWDSMGPDGLGYANSKLSATAAPHGHSRGRHEVAQAFHYVDGQGSGCLAECKLLVRHFHEGMGATIRLLAHGDSGPDEERMLWSGAPELSGASLPEVTEIMVRPVEAVPLEPSRTYWVCLSVDAPGTGLEWVSGWIGWEPASKILRAIGLGNLLAERHDGPAWSVAERGGAGMSLRVLVD
jgi:hypothetical protein